MFKSLLENLSEQEQEFYKKAAVDAAFCDWENTAQLQISVAYFCSIGLYFLV